MNNMTFPLDPEVCRGLQQIVEGLLTILRARPEMRAALAKALPTVAARAGITRAEIEQEAYQWLAALGYEYSPDEWRAGVAQLFGPLN